jgi:hypothetical protein
MAERRWLIPAGAVILVLMLVTAAFSLGVYVGEHGWTREGLTYQPQQPAGPLPGAGAPAGPGGEPPALTGRIRTIAPQGLELATPDGPRFVELTTDTRIEDPDGQELSLRDLSRGEIVAVFGELFPGDGPRLRASRIVLLPLGPASQP